MASTLKQVLTAFEGESETLSTGQLARRLQLEPAMLEGMLDYWVRKGKLREVNQAMQGCTTCGAKTGCPFIMAMPRQYERVRDGSTSDPAPACDMHQKSCARCG